MPVELGGRNGSVAWTKSGLSAGANVIVYPPAEVGDEVKVKGRKILESALRPEGRMKLGSLLADMGR